MLILNQSQALAVYNAMCELNNVSGRINCSLPPVFGGNDPWIKVVECPRTGNVVVSQYEREVHKNQAAFKEAYRIEG